MKQIIKTPGAVFNTCGNGYWSRERRPVKVKHIGIGYIDEDGKFGELRAYFNRTSWNIDKYGLIYTDDQWIEEFRKYITAELGLPGKDVTYSEQGMQGDDYVSMDIGKKFIDAWTKKTGVELEAGWA